MRPTTPRFKHNSVFISAIPFFAISFVSALTALGLYGLVQLGATQSKELHLLFIEEFMLRDSFWRNFFISLRLLTNTLFHGNICMVLLFQSYKIMICGYFLKTSVLE